MQPEAGHHALEWSQTLSNQDQIQEKCMHCWPEEQRRISKLDLISDVTFLIISKNLKGLDLARGKHFPLIFNWGKWTPTCKNGTTLLVMHKK